MVVKNVARWLDIGTDPCINLTMWACIFPDTLTLWSEPHKWREKVNKNCTSSDVYWWLPILVVALLPPTVANFYVKLYIPKIKWTKWIGSRAIAEPIWAEPKEALCCSAHMTSSPPYNRTVEPNSARTCTIGRQREVAIKKVKLHQFNFFFFYLKAGENIYGDIFINNLTNNVSSWTLNFIQLGLNW